MKFVRRIGSLVVFVLLVAGGTLFVWRHDAILDWVAQRNYHPSATVAQFVADTTMTPQSKQLFYANRPTIEDKDAFNQHCTDTTDQVATLGCYTGNRQGIYIYNVTDPRLAGVQQVTAAHEMLHQAYQRLSKSERQRIDSLLDMAYATLPDQAIRDQLASYKKTEPGQLANEMHSILGTETAVLSPKLEAYYARYFTNRAQIVQYYQQYRSEFDKRRQQIADYDSQLATWGARIADDKQALTAQQKAIEQRRTELDRYLDNNQVVTYNAAVPGFNAMVIDYRAKVKAINDLIEQYNNVLDARNAIAVQEQQLQQALDSHIDPANKQ